ncbi:LAFE_0D12706g1_1 [Lachancea fermentati]|uniref:LAFE_0D12706g1_1 n=1 Tax=Lachancea fermentati TaxID=4955 RepID=A0A1G4MCG6_LACFM|nr:LAFE_0D12706g1_1 [Lachancea fermentati]
MEQTNDEEALFRVISENLKYAFNSPIPTTTQFPTPYSQNHIAPHHSEPPLQNQNENQSIVENSILQGNSGTGTLSDMNVQPSSVLQLSNEFLLASPEQFKEFLFESPARLNLLHKTPAKTPLRFFNSTAVTSSQQQQAQITPLRNIDINLMFNSKNKPRTSSPSKRYLSLTPYGKRVLNDIGTPYAKMLASSNSALVDFHKARKDSTKTTFTPLKNRQSRSTRSLNSNHNEEGFSSDIEEATDRDGDCGSSPTTIQLNSSVTKSTRDKLGPISSKESPVFSSKYAEREPNIDETLFEVEKLPLSPTPKPQSSDLDVTSIKIPELPKMGSFKSERSLSVANGTKKVSKKQPKFQIIVTDANSFNSTKGTVMGGDTNGRKRKPGLKRSQSELTEMPASGRSKKQKMTPSLRLDFNGRYPSSQ